jgi:preprotein translocase subunit SecF
MLNILGKRYLFFAISLAFILPGMIILGIFGLHPSIDFTGGSLLELQFDASNLPQPAELVVLYKDLGVADVQVQTTNDETFIIRSNFLDDDLRNTIISTITENYGQGVIVLRSDSVGPTIGREVTGRASIAVIFAALGVIIYMTFAFRGVPHALRYGICAIIAMFHDVLIVISLVAIGGVLFGWQS